MSDTEDAPVLFKKKTIKKRAARVKVQSDDEEDKKLEEVGETVIKTEIEKAKKLQKERKRTAETDIKNAKNKKTIKTSEENGEPDYMASLMGFSGFGTSSKKN